MDQIDQMLSDFKEVSEIKLFTEAQHKTIIELSKKIKKLEDENNHLKKLLETSTPLIDSDKKDLIQSQSFLTSDEETICVTQLNKLRDVSFERELTLEESRRVEIFSKILTTLRNSPKTIKVESKKYTDAELIALIEKEKDHE